MKVYIIDRVQFMSIKKDVIDGWCFWQDHGEDIWVRPAQPPRHFNLINYLKKYSKSSFIRS